MSRDLFDPAVNARAALFLRVGPLPLLPCDVKAQRDQRGLTLVEVAELSGLGRSTLWRIETGQQRPGRSTLKLLAYVFAELDRQGSTVDA